MYDTRINLAEESNGEDINKEHPKVFPYIVTKLMLGAYHIIVLPRAREEDLLRMTHVQYLLNDLETCLVLAEKDSIFFDKNGKRRADFRPSGGALFINRLEPFMSNEDSKEIDPTFWIRCEIVRQRYVAQGDMNKWLFINPTKGGRYATKEELIEFRKPNIKYKGVPNGLIRCDKCFQFKGQCLDPSEKYYKGLIQTVHCKCDNENRCAHCLKLLYEYKLYANYYNEKDNSVWYVSGLQGFTHKCPIVL
ncbi:MAG: hypothetical protein PHZ07_02200 [Patescibacteria group bacterium]|nr:hypothetical protein [Patescibacteria group bacterium]MDD4304521.1 hypothetical protein [Patescibacteria group bacterium]MDD4694881.1 hypothetical protein [Patescibacteria group bacterium]